MTRNDICECGHDFSRHGSHGCQGTSFVIGVGAEPCACEITGIPPADPGSAGAIVADTKELLDQLVNGLPPLAKAAIGLSKLIMSYPVGPAVHDETNDDSGKLEGLADEYRDRCCADDCCGPGSWCCARANPHDHGKLDGLADDYAEPEEPGRVLPDPMGGCVCTPHDQDAGGGYVEHLLEYDPACPEHSEHLYDPRTGVWVLRKLRPMDTGPEQRRFRLEGAAVGCTNWDCAEECVQAVVAIRTDPHGEHVVYGHLREVDEL
jgi:hypothetical protein